MTEHSFSHKCKTNRPLAVGFYRKHFRAGAPYRRWSEEVGFVRVQDPANALPRRARGVLTFLLQRVRANRLPAWLAPLAPG